MAIDNVVIHDTHVDRSGSTLTQILSVSSNIGAAKIALGLGEQRLYEGFRRFGFGDTTGIPFPGESIGVLRPRGRPWVQVETASAAFGQGISVTTLQLAMAMARDRERRAAARARARQARHRRHRRDALRGARRACGATRCRRTVAQIDVGDARRRHRGRGHRRRGGDSRLPRRRARRRPRRRSIRRRASTPTRTTSRRSSGFVPAEKPRLVDRGRARRADGRHARRRIGRGARVPSRRRDGASLPGRHTARQRADEARRGLGSARRTATRPTSTYQVLDRGAARRRRRSRRAS